jgi:hypothetical protein
MTITTITQKCKFSRSDHTLKIDLPYTVASISGTTYIEMVHNVTYLTESKETGSITPTEVSQTATGHNTIIVRDVSDYEFNKAHIKKIYVTYTAEIN